ncbi:MAG: hypothetical protein AAF399_27330 [Bacteroidota bacterium]
MMKRQDLPTVEAEIAQELSGHRGSIYVMTIDETESQLFSGGDDGILAKWSLHDSAPEGTGILQTDRGIYALFQLPNQPILCVGTSDGNIYLVDLDTHQLIHTFRHLDAAVYGFFWEPELNWLCSLHGGGHIGAIEMPSKQSVGIFRLSTQHLRSCLSIPGTSEWLIGSSDHHIYRWKVGETAATQKWKAHDNSVFSMARVPATGQLLTGGRDAHLNLWELSEPPTRLHHIPAHNFTINDLCFSPSGEYFASGSRDKTIKLWRTDDLALIKVIDAARNQGHTHSVNRVIWLSSDKSVLSCSDDRRIIRWKLTIQEA